MSPRTSQSGYIAFQPRARLLKLIGAELISDEVVALTELVKNAHDADALSVTIEFRNATGPDGQLVVSDDGHGMSLGTLLEQWMQPASSSKAGTGKGYTRRGRRMLGEKGVGRFAVDKLARHLELISKRSTERREVRATFDWDEFDTHARKLSDIRHRWEVRPPAEVRHHGTILRMSGLRTPWSERMFRRLSAKLSRLRSPYAERDHFAVRIESDEFPDYAGDFQSTFLDRAPYTIDARFDGKESVRVSIDGAKPVQHLWNGNGELCCGPVRTRLFAFDLETDSLAAIGPRLDVRAWLKEWSGISIYRDGFRVLPYGEPHDDWLRLDHRRVNNPVVRLSNNQLVGFVDITRDENPELVDQTNREGLVRARAFDDLRRLLYFVLQLIEAERQRRRHPREPPSRRPLSEAVTQGAPLSDRLTALARRAPADLRRDLTRLASRFQEEAAGRERQRRAFAEGYSELAALGQSAISFSEMLASIHEDVKEGMTRLGRALPRRGRGSAHDLLDGLRESVDRLGDAIEMISTTDTAGLVRRRMIDVPAEVRRFEGVFEGMPGASRVAVKVVVPRRGLLRVDMRPEIFHRLLHVLATNSLEWLRRTSQPRITITCRGVDRWCEILMADNGSGIRPELATRVFEPLFSGREGGRGMGLTIARDIVTLHGGRIEALCDRRRRGATLRIHLPLRRSRAAAVGR